MDWPQSWRSKTAWFLPTKRAIVIFTLFLVSWWAYYYATQIGQIGYLLIHSYNSLELLRPSALDSSVYWWFFPVYLYILALLIARLLSVIDDLGESAPE